MSDNYRILEARIVRLETLNFGLVIVLIFLFGLGGYFLNQGPTVVKARQFQLVDAEGNLMAELATRDVGPGLFLKDAGGRDRISLFHAADATGLYIFDDREDTRIGIAQFSHGGGGVALHGSGAKGAAVLYYKDGGSLRFFGQDGSMLNQVSESTVNRYGE